MDIMVVGPFVGLVTLLSFIPRIPQLRRLIVIFVLCAAADTVVTVWFVRVSDRKFFNASWF